MKRRNSFLALALIVCSLAAVPLTTTVAVQQKTEALIDKPTHWPRRSAAFAVKSGFDFQPGFIDLTTVGLSSAPLILQLTPLLTDVRVIPVLTHRPFT